MAIQDIYRLTIFLDEAQPLLWRTLLVPGDTSLDALHRVIQIAMGWTNSHPYEFKVRRLRYTDHSTLDEDDRSLDSRNHALGRLGLTRDKEFRYLYDFGDNWQHTVRVNEIEHVRDGIYPRCVAGERACPPEDCGGMTGYVLLLAALADPTHPEHASSREWVGRAFDPERFDVNAVNRRLARLAPRATVAKRGRKKPAAATEPSDRAGVKN